MVNFCWTFTVCENVAIKLLKLLTWKKSNYELCFLGQGCHIETLASPRVMGLTHPLHRLVGNNVTWDETKHPVALWNVSLSTCSWNWDICLSPHHSTVFCSKVTLFSHLKCSFLLQWLHCLVARVCQGRIRLAQIMKIRRSSTYPEPWKDHYLRITVPT